MVHRSAEIYVQPTTIAKLRFLADVCKVSCADEYAEQVLIEHMAAMYPTLDAVMAKATAARKKVLEESKAELETNQTKGE